MSGRVLGVTLGIVTALGGFVDIGELLFASLGGARFEYATVWAVVLGAGAIVVYSEQCGRVAIVTGKPVFVVVRERLGYSVGLGALITSTVVNVLTCAAEVGGVAIALRLLTGLPYGIWVVIGVLVLVAVVALVPFEGLERLFGLVGLCILAFTGAAIVLGPDWGALAGGLIPNVPQGLDGGGLSSYGYLCVGLVAGTVMPYEVQFYSSGNVEEGKTPGELLDNGLVAIVGLLLGAVVTTSLVITGAEVLAPLGIQPGHLGTPLLAPIAAFGVPGLLLGLVGILFAVGGAAVETSLAGAYGVAQFFGLEWGKSVKPWRVPRFTLSWLVVFGLASLILASGIDPLEVTELAVVFSVVILPLTYLPILLAARDRQAMGEHTNGRLQDALAIVFLGLITVVAVVAVPLMWLSRFGNA